MVNFECNGVQYTYIVQEDYTSLDGEAEGMNIVTFKYGDTEVYRYEIYQASGSGGWKNAIYRTIDFGTSAQEVSSDFYAWLIQNAKRQN